ncbi:alpha-ketoglutaric semialdehyde dehydrogenase [Catalinimonas alkaloidigena]|uniref:aldehyde dehydrogenase (NADP(+)) n=1 Tax=Catalinimonas alkaloidigena TaxID=1075417 RepID=UPI0024072733|nr:aldehyde dehydrogenase (NADP(+)) [Catalinimonas alkaloidigena]MDF9797580.1 alpha-ketoglutaric semialdehyde dehydrogenase [Catalinimonas alkaloidigena]
MQLNGKHIIAGNFSKEGSDGFQGVNPVNGESLAVDFCEATHEEIERAIQQAEVAFQHYRKASGKKKAAFLDKIGEEIMALGDDLLQRCEQETGLPQGRLQGERARTVNQLKMFAELLREGSWVDARIDTAIPDRQPLPKPDLRMMQIALGPVGIFGASNFPLAFSVAGGDTASALAAGCSIVVKAHPAHPGTSEMVGRAIMQAAKACNLPKGVFSMVQGRTPYVGMAIVNHPLIKAVGFTGSFNGGKALFDAAAKREEPIPVYAEMGSTNPVFVLPGALKEKSEQIAQGLVNSVTLGVGQFCTNPGVVISLKSKQSEEFATRSGELLQEINTGAMLTDKIKDGYEDRISKFTAIDGVKILGKSKAAVVSAPAVGHVFQTDANTFMKNPDLSEEVFGPSTIHVSAGTKSELMKLAVSLEGHLTATLQATEEDLEEYQDLVEILERKVGRLIVNGFPTGVEVCHSMVHGGPFPATTDSKTTSVGTAAINRFSRPVSYQGFPQFLLPDELKDDNPLGIWRLLNGNRTQESI